MGVFSVVLLFAAVANSQIASKYQGSWTGNVNYTSLTAALTCCATTPGPYDGMSIGPGGLPASGGFSNQMFGVYTNDVTIVVTGNTITFTSFGAKNPDPVCGGGLNGTVFITGITPNTGAPAACWSGIFGVSGFGAAADMLLQNVHGAFVFNITDGSPPTAVIAVNLLASYVQLNSGCPGTTANGNVPYTPFQCYNIPTMSGTMAFDQWVLGTAHFVAPLPSSSLVRPSSSAGSANAASGVDFKPAVAFAALAAVVLACVR